MGLALWLELGLQENVIKRSPRSCSLRPELLQVQNFRDIRLQISSPSQLIPSASVAKISMFWGTCLVHNKGDGGSMVEPEFDYYYS